MALVGRIETRQYPTSETIHRVLRSMCLLCGRKDEYFLPSPFMSDDGGSILALCDCYNYTADIMLPIRMIPND